MTASGRRRLDADTADFQIPLRFLRQTAAINQIKRLALGEAHVPNSHQATEVMAAFDRVGLIGALDVRTWRGWFGDPVRRRARIDGLRTLDRYLDAIDAPTARLSSSDPPKNRFCVKLLEDGLVVRLLNPTEAKRVDTALMQRAFEYSPESPLHLHIDAIEAVFLSSDVGDVAWEWVKALAASRVLSLLHQRWSKRNGTVYGSLSRDPDPLANGTSSDGSRSEQGSYERLLSDLYSDHCAEGPRPDWTRMGSASDAASTDVHFLLVSMASDSEFLVNDRLEAWALDLASATFAAHALALTDGYRTYGATTTRELLFADAFLHLFLEKEWDRLTVTRLVTGLEMIGVRWTDDTLQQLERARIVYQTWLANLGLGIEDLTRVFDAFMSTRPLTYIPSAKPTKM